MTIPEGDIAPSLKTPRAPALLYSKEHRWSPGDAFPGEDITARCFPVYVGMTCGELRYIRRLLATANPKVPYAREIIRDLLERLS